MIQYFDITKIIDCEDKAFVEELLRLGDEIAPESAIVKRMEKVVFRVAKMIVTINKVLEEKERQAALAEGRKIRPKKNPTSSRNCALGNRPDVSA